jgi:hypothetical protein
MLCRVTQQRQHSVADKIRRRFVTGDQQQYRCAQQFVIGQAAAIFFRCD